jgi:hypothetical protein
MEQSNERMVTEDDLIDYVYHQLYTNLHKNELHLENDILLPTKIALNDHQLEHIRELLLATNFVKSSVGFGKRGFIYLTAQGIQMMKMYNSYSGFLRTHPHHAGMHGNLPEQNKPNTSLETNTHNPRVEGGYDDMAK